MGDYNMADDMQAPPQAGFLAPPAVASLKQEAKSAIERINMERSASQDFREEREDLKKAAEQSLNAILELDLEEKVRWVSPSWQDLTGTAASSIVGKPMADLVVENPGAFPECVEWMRKDDSKSKIIRFSVRAPVVIGIEDALSADDKTPVEPKASPQWPTVEDPDQTPKPASEEDEDNIVDLEAQGIMVYDRASGEESHTMWMVKPAISREITIDLPEVIVSSLGIGAEMLAHYLTTLAEVGMQDPENHPPPLPVLCRICERQITPWWFEKHTELCSQEHRAEMEVQMAQESLQEHRSALVKVLDALEAQSRKARTPPTETGSPAPAPPARAEYKSLPIGPPPSASSSGSTSGRASPASQPTRSRDSSTSGGLSHSRARSFAVRRPLARIVELVLDLCDTAMEISTPAIKDTRGQASGELRTQSPQSESRLQQVMQWQSPSQSSLENEQGLSLLCDDTSQLAKTKVDAVFRHRQILEYSERIRVEYDVLVQECIEAALEKARRIAAGELSDSSSSDDSTESAGSARMPTTLETHAEEAIEPLPESMSSFPSDEGFTIGSFSRSPGPSAMAMALRTVSDQSLDRRNSSAGSSRASSPRGTTTPKSYGTSSELYPFTKRGSIAFESDTGADSDSGSVKSSVTTQSQNFRRTESPSADTSLSRVASSRERKRRSLVLPSLVAQQVRHQSPGRGPPPPSSPLRMTKPRIPSGASSEHVPSPIVSPILSHSELASPVIHARGQSHHHHHRRQSSAALSEAMGRPASPRLTGANPQPRAVQTSIKDFEVIKPISKGAFGSVYLAKKKSTGDYFAIKVLKKADMVAKNQVTNVKAERAIMMWQGESDFVAKLYWTFSSKDYLYLVMEYLNGGDCASLIKVLGTLPEDWTKKYIAEVVVGVQHLHGRQIVHRDLKPDNLLIDAKGHLKLTDFGLSRMGLIGRQKRVQNAKPNESQPPDLFKQGLFKRAPSVGSSRSTSFDFQGVSQSPAQTPALTPAVSELGQPSYFSLSRESSRDPSRRTSGHRSDSNESELSSMFRRFSMADGRTPIEEETASEEGADSPDPYALHPVKSNGSQQRASTPPQQPAMLPPMMALFDPEDSSRRFVGTPDYLAPETINGAGQDEMSDWWSLGCILFECLYGRPPFNADTPEEVFQKILARDVQWPEDEDEDCASPDAKDLMNMLMCLDPKERLGSNRDEKYDNGGEEIKAHPWFSDINWESLREDEASFVPLNENPEDTEYFDARGASMQNFAAEFQDQESSPANTPGADYPDRPHDALSRVRNQVNSLKRGLMPLHIPPHVRDSRSRRLSEPVAADDFGNFQFKNLPVLEKANKDVIQKMRADTMQAQAKSALMGQSPSPAVLSPSPPSQASLEASPVLPMPLKRTLSSNKGNNRPHSPSLLSQSNSSPSRGSQPSSPLLVSFSAGAPHERRKTSSGSSNLSQQTSNSLQPGNFFDQAPRMPALLKASSSTPSPVKGAKSGSISQLPLPDQKGGFPHRRTSISSPRQRSHTVGSQEGDLVPDLISAHKRRSQVFDISPSSSDNEETRHQALLRVQRRRQSSRRMSQITLADGPVFRTLDVLVCEDHPVSRLVMDRLLDKLRCRTITVHNGSEAMRVAMSEIKFDIIMTEYKLPQINGADVARMIRDTRNPNSHTPIVAVTGYLKELQAPHHFDALIEKPPTREKLEEVMGRFCQWKPPPEGWKPPPPQGIPQSSLRQESLPTDNSPTTTTSSGFSGFPPALSSSYRGSSREDSIGSSSLGDTDNHYDSIPVIISRQATNEFHDADLERNFGGLGITSPVDGPPDSKDGVKRDLSPHGLHALQGLPYEHISEPVKMELPEDQQKPRKVPSSEAIEAKRRSLEKTRHESAAESGDDEDEELGNVTMRQRSPKRNAKRMSKLGTEMMRANSQGSIVSAEDIAAAQNFARTPTRGDLSDQAIAEEMPTPLIGGHLTPPEFFPLEPGSHIENFNMDAVADADVQTTPRPPYDNEPDPDPTPRASTSPCHRD